MSTHRSTKAVAHRPSQSSLRALDERLQMLRAEARKGLGSKDVRRELIKEVLRRPTPPSSVCAGASAQGARVRSHTVNSVSGGSMTISTGVDADVAGIPPAWLEGDFYLESAGDSRDGGKAAPASTNVVSTEKKSIASSHLTSRSPPVSSDILRMYQSLCTVAQEVDYDVSHEEELHKVEVRDSETGLATTWRTRRCPPALWPCSFSAAMLTPEWSGVQQDRPPAPGNLVGAVTNRSAAGLHQLYTVPPSRQSTHRDSAPGRLAASRSVPLPFSEASVIPISASSEIILTGNVISPTPRSSGGGSGTSSSLSTEGSVVVRSSAATYVRALRQLVHTQRRQVTILGGATPPLNASSAVWSGSGNDGSGDIPAALEWRAHMTAPVTLAVCSSCHKWFERQLQQPHQLYLSLEGQQKAEGDSNDLGWRCPRCGHVDARDRAGLSTDSAAVGAEPRWAWEPAVVTGASTGASQAPLNTSVGIFSSSEALTPNQRASPAQTSDHRSTAPTRGETCGTDSVSFTEGDEGESFAALVARIRASRARDHRSDGAINHVPPSAAESVFPRAAVHGDLSPACTVAGVSGKTTTLPSAAAVAAEGAPTEPSVWSTPTALGPVNPVALSLRVALSHPYFDDLWASAMEGRL